jgi:hypothetical protein
VRERLYETASGTARPREARPTVRKTRKHKQALTLGMRGVVSMLMLSGSSSAFKAKTREPLPRGGSLMKPVSLEDLERRHRSLDSEVHRLERQVYLTSMEQHQVAELKKEKLRTRDLIQDLRRS